MSEWKYVTEYDFLAMGTQIKLLITDSDASKLKRKELPGGFEGASQIS